MQEDQRGLLPILGPLSRQGSSNLVSLQGLPCRDRVLRPSARPGLGGRDKHARTIELSSPVSRQRSSCPDRVPRHTGRFGSQQRLSLSRQRFFASCRDRNFVSRQGSPCVATKFSQDWVIPVAIEDFMSRQGLRGWCCDREFPVATHRPGLHAR